MSELKQIKKQIDALIDTWEGFNLSDTNALIDLRRQISVYSYRLSEIASINRFMFIKNETYRKNEYNRIKHEEMSKGSSGVKSESEAQEKVAELRIKEVEYEGLYKSSETLLGAVYKVLDSIASAINLNTKERQLNKD